MQKQPGDRSAPRDSVPRAATPSRERLTPRERHVIAKAPGEMEALSAEIVRHEATLAAPDLYAKDPAKFAATAKSLDDAREKLAALEEEWLAAEMRREEIG